MLAASIAGIVVGGVLLVASAVLIDSVRFKWLQVILGAACLAAALFLFHAKKRDNFLAVLSAVLLWNGLLLFLLEAMGFRAGALFALNPWTLTIYVVAAVSTLLASLYVEAYTSMFLAHSAGFAAAFMAPFVLAWVARLAFKDEWVNYWGTGLLVPIYFIAGIIILFGEARWLGEKRRASASPYLRAAATSLFLVALAAVSIRLVDPLRPFYLDVSRNFLWVFFYSSAIVALAIGLKEGAKRLFEKQ